MKIRILLVEDLHVVREGFKAILGSQPELEVVGETDDGATAIQLAGELLPDVVIMDISLRSSEMTGVQATRKITSLHPQVKIIALSVWEDAARVKAMTAAGASGYLSKKCTSDELMEAIETVMEGRTYFSAAIAEVVQEAYVNIVRNKARNPQDLNDRERYILRLIAMGENTKAIAAELNISPKTVDHHRRKLMQKLNLDNIADLTKYAIREKIIHDDE